MEEKILKKYKEHLGLLGYTIESRKGFSICKHQNKSSFLIAEVNGNPILQRYYKTSKYVKLHRESYLRFINELNEKGNITIYCDVNGDLSGRYLVVNNKYDKIESGTILSLWEEDAVENLASSEQLAKYLV